MSGIITKLNKLIFNYEGWGIPGEQIEITYGQICYFSNQWGGKSFIKNHWYAILFKNGKVQWISPSSETRELSKQKFERFYKDQILNR